MARLPVEISSEIFMQCLASLPLPKGGIAPMLFLGVCRLWNDIALSTPALWTIHSTTPTPSGFGPLFETWLSRARSLPLSVSLDGHISAEVSAVLKKHAPQLRVLELVLESPKQREEMIATSFPALEILSIQDTRRGGNSFLWGCVEIMRAAPALRDCEFTSMMEEQSIRPYEDPLHLTHSSLRQLRFGRPKDDGESRDRDLRNSAKLLNFLTLPALEILLDISNAHFLSFLGRSSPPLQSLHIKMYPDGGVEFKLDWLQLVPGLVCFTLDLDNFVGYPIPVLDRMARDDNLLPNLHHLTITCWPALDEGYKDLIRVITSRGRRTGLESFQLIFPFISLGPGEYLRECAEHKPHNEDIDSLQLCVEKGTRIHIGPEWKNYI